VLARLASTSKAGAPAQTSDLARMKQDLARSHELGKACIDAQGAMIRRYKL